MLFEMIFWLDYYSRRSLKPFGFVLSSLPAIVVDGSKSFSFPGSLITILSSNTPGSVSLVLGFAHDKSVRELFSTPQARSQQQTEILIHLLKKLAPANDISGVLYLVDPMWIFFPRIWNELQLKGSCACANKIPKQQYLWTWCQSVVPKDAPRDFGPEVAFGAKFQIPVARQGGREMSAPRPYVTEPFRPFSSISSWQ